MRNQDIIGLAQMLGRDTGIKITVSGNQSWCSADNTAINIACIEDSIHGKRLMIGLAYHEIGHKKFTVGQLKKGFLGSLTNCIEDTRIDKETIKERPGAKFTLEEINNHYAAKGGFTPQDPTSALSAKVLGHGYGVILNQKAMLPIIPMADEILVKAFGADFVDELDKIIEPMASMKSLDDAEAIAKAIIDLLEKEKEQKEQDQENQKEQDKNDDKGNGDDNSDSDADNDSDDSQSDSDKDSKSSSQSSSSDESDSSDGENSSGDDSDPSENEDAESDNAKSDNGKESKSGKPRNSGNASGPTDKGDISPEEIAEMLESNSTFGNISEEIMKELDQMAEKSDKERSENGTYYEKPELPEIGGKQDNPYRGRFALDESKAIAASSRMRAKLFGLLQARKREPVIHGSSGKKIATNRLVKMATKGDPKIFKKKQEVQAINTAVVVLLDGSGSMHNFIDIAPPAAFALHHTLYGIGGVNVCSIEFQDDKTNVLADFKQKPDPKEFAYYPEGGTPTHQGLWAARAKLMQRPETRKIVLIVTDGDPNCKQSTIGATKRLEKEGIEIAAIGIGDVDVTHKLWKNSRHIDDISGLPKAMFEVMENLLLQ